MRKTILLALFCIFVAVGVSAQTTAFTYQGSLQSSGNPANGNYDFEFKLFDLVSAGSQQGSTLQRLNVAVANGSFTVTLDFGAGTLSGADRFLDIAVRTAGGGAFTSLSPRPKVNSAPYSVKSLNSTNADTATNATQLGGVAANQYVVTTDPRMTNSRPPTAGSTNYIQNQDAVPQPSSNFNISGTGTANFVNAATQFNLNNSRILGAPSNNLFVGFQTGQSNTTGLSNSFFGFSAGANNTSGGNNSFFGYLAGNSTNTGNGNAFFGYQAGRSNTTGGVNSYFGFNAGEFSTTANYNSFFGFNAGNKTTSENNSFFGASAGQNTTTGGGNTFVGTSAGQANTTGGVNSFLGFNSGLNNTTGTENAFFGAAAGQFNTIGNQNSFFGYAAGYQTTGYENSFFGRLAGTSNTTGFQNSFFGRNAGLSNTTGDNNSFFGTAAGEFNTSGVQNSFFGGFAGEFNTTGSANSFFGFVAGFQNTTGDRNSIFGFDAGRLNQTGIDNSLFGHSAGRNTTGSNNAFFGSAAGTLNAAGNSNAFFGRNTGVSNTSGNENSFFGAAAGSFNTTGIRNSAVGFNANVGAGNLQYATAIGAESTVSTSNTIALGRSSGADQVVIPGNLVANLPAGDGDYIQNRTTPQSANFNVSGNGTLSGTLSVGNVGTTNLTAVGVTSSSLSSTSSLFLNSASGNRIALRTTGGSTERVTILDNGNVGIGITNPTSVLNVANHLMVNSSGSVQVRLLNTKSTEQVCYNRALDPGTLVTCFSAAEYVPSIDRGMGFPEAADLVSIIPSVKNPYGDTHGPFTVEKSVTACDANLFGFIVDPESGANGPKLNEHYLPLAIYGYFPAKVTLENGPIKRGDPITSSSKAGFGMKATNACKIIGYALEDADQEGKIQVFSNLSEYYAPVVKQLRSQVETQQTVIDKLEKRLEQLENAQAK